MKVATLFVALLSLWITGSNNGVVVGQLTFDTQTAGASTNRVKDLVFKNRLYVPYGPDLTTTPAQNSTNGEIWSGYGFGLGAVEHYAYDPVHRYVYTQSEFDAYVVIIDYMSIEPNSGYPKITPFSLDLTEYDSDIRDIAVCNEYLMIVATEANIILQYETVKRSGPQKPKLIKTITAGMQPDNIRFNSDCTIMAVANENDGSSTAVGTIHIVTSLDQEIPTVREIALNKFDDSYLLGRNVHMPLTLNAMEYWDDYSAIADDLNWTTIRADYSPNLFLQPEFIQFTPDSKTLLVNLQTNSAMARIDLLSASLTAIDGYGLKSWTSGDGIDIIDDEGCDKYITHPLLYSIPAPDGFATVEVDNTLYVILANEGSDFDYEDYEEKIEAGDLFNGVEFGQQGFVVNATLFSTVNSTIGASTNFNSDCELNGLEWCASGLEITLGSSAVDYTNASAPVFQRIVAFGGRGMSIYKLPSANDDDGTATIEFVWDSQSDFEIKGCEAFPWAHNGVQDEAFAPLDGALYQLSESDVRDELDDANDPAFDGCADAGDGNPGACPISETIDAKAQEDGLAPESVVVAIACSRLVAISCGENNGNCYMYDITTITAPEFIQVINLSPASETQSPGVAYKAGTLGDIDAETVRYVPPNESPTGLAGIMFGGAHSGTLSFYEFECTEAVDAVPTVFVGSNDSPMAAPNPAPTMDESISESSGLSTGAIAGISIGAILGIGLVLLLLFNSQKKPTNNVMDTSKPEQDLS